MSRFTKFESYKKLSKLAEKPIDLTEEGLTKERLEHFHMESDGYKLLFGTERVTDDVIGALSQLAEEAQAVQQMEKMQAGDVMNFIEGIPSERRSVLHTAVRDFFDKNEKGERAKEATNLAKKEIEKLQKFMEDIDKEDRFSDLIMIGIGGSDLGPRANYLALQNLEKSKKKAHFISNVDPDDAAGVLQGLNLETCLVAVVSKSGTTLETGTNEAFVRSRFLKAQLKPEEHFVAITGQGSPMDDPKKYIRSFYIWDWIGGRYSSTSMVGGLLLSFTFGFTVYWDFLKGANAMDKVALQQDVHKNLPLMVALLGIWNRNFLGYPTVAVIPYSQALLRFPAHIQQLDMESNGKRIDHFGNPLEFAAGPIIWGEPGTNSQHSFFQLIHQGKDVVPIEFIGYKESQYQEDIEYKGTSSQQKLLSNLFAQSLALAMGKKVANPNQFFPGNRPSHIILGRRLTPFSLGALLSLFEHKVAFQGFIWGINSFDQEGVQLGKVVADKILSRFSLMNREEKDTSYHLADSLIKQLDDI